MPTIHTFTEPGGHPLNEDAFRASPHPNDPTVCLCVLADGQGGRAGGGEAARLACQVAFDYLLTLSSAGAADHPAWETALRSADSAVEEDARAGFTTLIGLAIAAGEVVGASCGDSAAWAVDASGKVVELTARQQKNPPVGSGVAFFMPFEHRLAAPWQVLVVSDGVWKPIGHERLRELLREHRGADLVAALQAAGRLPGSGKFSDDFTAVVLTSG